jgi:predicted RNA-binding protein Jag
VDGGVQEAEKAADRVISGKETTVELSPQSSYIRRLQHQIAEKYNLDSQSTGKEPFRRVTLFSPKGSNLPREDRAATDD